MDKKRKAGFTTLFNLMKRKGPYSIIGLAFIILSVMILLFVCPFWIAFRGENSGHNFDAIGKYGVQKDAKITYIKIVTNLSINEEHPVIISYEYDDNENKIKDKFETLDLENIAGLNVGSVIKIVVYDHQSMIKGVEPYTFPNWIFYLIPLPLFIAGIILLLIGLIPALKIYDLYRTGVVKDAAIIPPSPNNEVGSLADFKRKFTVNYYFMDEYQNKVYGECEPTDLLFFIENKGSGIIKIFVSKDDETKNCIVPRLEAMKYNWSI